MPALWSGAIVALILAIVLINVGTAASPICFDCQNIPFPRDCDNVMQCGSNSKCYTEQVVTASGLVLYNTGCRSTARCGMSKRSVVSNVDSKTGLAGNAADTGDDVIEQSDNILLCEKCCDGDYCNTQGCGSKALPPRISRGPVCFNCHQQEKHNSCYSVKVCDLNEKCSLRSYVSGTSDRIYSSECLSATICDQVGVPVPQSVMVGRRNSINCHGCCNTDFCNSDCSALQNPNSTNQKLVYSLTTQVSSTDTPIPSTQQTVPLTTLQRETLCQSKGYTYNKVDKVCYKIYHDNKMTWSSARQQCKADDGDLIIFRSRTEESLFSSLIAHLRAKQFYWVGASDIQQEGTWHWVDGSPVDMSLFMPNQPDNRPGENCAALAHFVTIFALTPTMLNDGVCTGAEHFICEINFQTAK